jgi:import inner membrane translocase subunit TIM10
MMYVLATVMWPKLRKSAPTPARASACAYSTNPSNHNNLTPINASPPTYTHSLSLNKQLTTHNTSQKCPSSSAKVAPSPLPPRRSQQQKPRSRWSPTCSTSKAFPSPSIFVRVALPKKRLRTNTLSTNRLVDTCTKKCIPPQYREADLNKGESVCLDRCVSKFFEVNVKVSEKMQGEAQAKQGGGFA